jgi:hypothetical protein
MTITTRTLLSAICFGLCASLAACGEVDPSDGLQIESAALMNTGGGATGGACTVTDGPHSGMNGTYDADGWCCAGNVCVECAAGASGKARCKDAVKVAVGGTVTIGTAIQRAGATMTLAR